MRGNKVGKYWKVKEENVQDCRRRLLINGKDGTSMWGEEPKKLKQLVND